MTIRKNNVYNFKNPIRHFLNIEDVRFLNQVERLVVKDLAWTEPIIFRIRKEQETYRTLKFPNILNFNKAYSCFKSYDNFYNTDMMDIAHKRLVPNLETGDFVAGVYDNQLEDDFCELSIYDNLIKLDIKSYYGRVYTHHLGIGSEETFLTNLNRGNSNGLIMGNYISLYFAEKYLTKISQELEAILCQSNIDCSFTYFSDDFYVFCNKRDNEQIINIFDSVLEKHDLERNIQKIVVWDYMKYNNHHKVEKYWKKIISESKARYNLERKDNNLYFINQLIYRASLLEEEKMQRSFLVNFFKSTYFSQLDIQSYKLEKYNYHQLCYIFKFVPEVLIYAIGKFSYYDCFRSIQFKRFLIIQYKEALSKLYHEEQLYYYYAIKLLGFDDILEESTESVITGDNQVLISYYLKEGVLKENQIQQLELKQDENYWLQNYHLILYTNLIHELDKNIDKYLIPREAIKSRQKQTYHEFYKENLMQGISLLNDVSTVGINISEYIESKIEERIELLGYEYED